MRTTFRGDIPPYLGAVLTDRFTESPLPIEVCGLIPNPGGAVAAFWEWHWDAGGGPVNHGPVREEIQGCRLAVLDAPQGLAKPGAPMRQCEIASQSRTRTPDSRTLIASVPGFINSSLDFFLALHKAGMPLDQPETPHAVVEFLPDYAWKRLAGASSPLSRKDTPQGVVERLEILRICGVQIHHSAPTAPRLDACLGALVAMSLDGRAHHIDAEMVGTRAYLDGAIIREGRLGIAKPGLKLSAAIRESLLRLQGTALPEAIPAPVRQAEQEKAQALLDLLVARFRENRPALATYDHAYEYIFGTRPRPWLAHIHPAKVLGYAALTAPHEVEGFGRMRLDTFTVSRGTRKPARGHWEAGLGYDERAWHNAFKKADLLK
jgi:hypothetical protein